MKKEGTFSGLTGVTEQQSSMSTVVVHQEHDGKSYNKPQGRRNYRCVSMLGKQTVRRQCSTEFILGWNKLTHLYSAAVFTF